MVMTSHFIICMNAKWIACAIVVGCPCVLVLVPCVVWMVPCDVVVWFLGVGGVLLKWMDVLGWMSECVMV